MAGIAGEIEFNILPRELNSLGTTVNRMNQLRSSSHGVDRKTARIAEHVEHATPLCIVLEKQPIVALIDEEALDAEQRTVAELQEDSVEADEPEQDEAEQPAAKSRRFQMAI